MAAQPRNARGVEIMTVLLPDHDAGHARAREVILSFTVKVNSL
jgi:hypothetical protein